MMNLGPGNGENSLGNGIGRQYQRHTLEQRQRLEEVFNNCPNPTKELQQTLSEELNLELKQIKYWFQNRRARRKNENDRANADALKLENERLLEENKKLKIENVKLKQEHERCPKAIDYQNSDNQLAVTVFGSSSNALQAVSPHLLITPDKNAIVVELARRMSISFWSVSGKFDFPHLPYVGTNDVRVSVRFNDVPGVPSHSVLGAASSLLLDVSHVTLCDFFDNDQTRFQWDLCTDETSTKVIEDIHLGPVPGHRVSIYQASSRSENSLFILQDYSNTSQGSAIVYAPIHPEWVRSVFSGGVNPSYMPLLPVGFLISGDASSEKSAGGASSSSSSRMPGRSLLTVLYQVFSGSVSDQEVSVEAVDSIKNFVASTMQRIKAALSG